ncbi:MAG: CBS domain-containing protein [Motiliproteus sp.]
MNKLKAADVMMRPVVSAKRQASARDIALQLLNGLYSGMPITEEGGKVVGVVTELDLINAALEGKELTKLSAEDIMNKEAISVDVETPVTEIINIMKEKGIIRLPVTEEERLVGIIARCDILKSLIEPEFVTYM